MDRPKNEVVKVDNLLLDIKQFIEQARRKVGNVANYEMTLLYWNIGTRINRDVLRNQRADYGKKIVDTLSHQLIEEYGEKGFNVRNIRRMMQFAQQFPDYQIVSPLATQLSWTHIIEVLSLKDDLQREFYLTMASTERWSKRVLQERIDSMLYERTLISGKPDEVIRQELALLRGGEDISPDLVFRNPYFLEFTGLKGVYSEKSLEESLSLRLQEFILELGNGFTFVDRQKRMIIDGQDFYLDLLFYHRKLRRLIAVELKIGRFKAQYKGQMELYLRWLERNEVERGEESPLGLILCTEGNSEQIELLQLDQSGIKVAQYFTELPSRELISRQLRQSIEETKRLHENFRTEEG